MPDPSDEPLIYTTKGNLPIKDLRYQHRWEEDAAAITLIEEYYLDDELVKRSSHVRLKKGLSALVQQQLFGAN
jgi:hypothetical protein